MTDPLIRTWRRLDIAGTERFVLERVPDGLRVTSVLVEGGADGFGLRYVWRLDPDWRTRSLWIAVGADDERSVRIERVGPTAWTVDGVPRPDLDGCLEPDLSETPFCNMLAIRRLGPAGGELTVLYVLAPGLACSAQRQAYEPLGPDAWRFIGIADGFRARLDLDPDGFVARYEGLWEQVS